MITQADIVFAPDGAALVALHTTGMDPHAETLVSVSACELRIGQGSRWFVAAKLPSEDDARALNEAPVIEVVEVSEMGFELHENVRRS